MNTTRYTVLANGKILCSGFTSRKLAQEWAEREVTGAYWYILTDRKCGVVA